MKEGEFRKGVSAGQGWGVVGGWVEKAALKGGGSRGHPGQGPGRARAEVRGPPEKMKDVNCGQGEPILQGLRVLLAWLSLQGQRFLSSQPRSDPVGVILSRDQ